MFTRSHLNYATEVLIAALTTVEFASTRTPQ